MSKALRIIPLFALAALAYTNLASAVSASALQCDDDGSLCTETVDPIGYRGAYTGHDEPSLLFYSQTPGSGNTMTWSIRLPSDPPKFPNQLGTGGTFNLQDARYIGRHPGTGFMDTGHGLEIRIFDLTTGEHGSMIASAANGFTQLLFQPMPRLVRHARLTSIPPTPHPVSTPATPGRRIATT